MDVVCFFMRAHLTGRAGGVITEYTDSTILPQQGLGRQAATSFLLPEQFRSFSISLWLPVHSLPCLRGTLPSTRRRSDRDSLYKPDIEAACDIIPSRWHYPINMNPDITAQKLFNGVDAPNFRFQPCKSASQVKIYWKRPLSYFHTLHTAQ